MCTLPGTEAAPCKQTLRVLTCWSSTLQGSRGACAVIAAPRYVVCELNCITFQM
jgi:hypothetical protein